MVMCTNLHLGRGTGRGLKIMQKPNWTENVEPDVNVVKSDEDYRRHILILSK